MTASRKAFTLMEALLALAIVALAVVALLRLHLISLGTVAYTQDATRATLLAQEKMDECLVQPWPSLTSRQGRTTGPAPELHWTTTVTPADVAINQRSAASNQLAPLRHVHVQVTWQRGRSEKHVDLDTFVTNLSSQTQVVGHETP